LSFKTTQLYPCAAQETYSVLPYQVPLIITVSVFSNEFSETGCKGKNFFLFSKLFFLYFNDPQDFFAK